MLSSTFQASPINLNLDDDLKLIEGEYNGIDFPIVFKQKYGKKLTDILDTGFPKLYLISEKLKKVIEENKLTGWKIYSIKLFDKKGNEIFGYHGFSLTGRCTSIDYGTEIIEKRMVPDGPVCRYYKGIFVNNWDGTDFFIPEGTLYTFMTEKTADLLKKNEITNLRMVNLLDEETDVDL
jgi:hypothetical protein